MRSYRTVDFAVLADHRMKLKESEKNDKYLNLARELKKLWNMKVMIIPTVNWYSHQRIGIETGGFENKRTSGNHPNYHIVEISKNTEKSPGDLRLAVTQTSVKDHQLMVM